MVIKTAEYTGSYVDVAKCPQAKVPEFAFIGRSNVGKSSLINYLTGRKKLVKVSVTPGKTQTINYFDINNQFNFVDLPGYGYAKISRGQREKWNVMIKNYLLKREQLVNVGLLIDSRIPPQQVDLDFANWMGENQVPFLIIFTKADKPGNRETAMNVANFKNTLLKSWEELPLSFVTSAEKNVGREKLMQLFKEQVDAYFKQDSQTPN